MKNEIEQYELIERFLNGQLNGKELSAIQERIENDSVFSVEVQKHAKFHKFIFERSMIDMKDQIKNIHKHSGTPGKIKYGWRSIFSYLGAIIITGAIFYGFYAKKQYNEGAFLFFKNNQSDTISVLSDTTPIVKIKQSKKYSQQPIAATDSLLVSDTIFEVDTLVKRSEESELALSDILNSGAVSAETEKGANTVVEEIKVKTITERNADPNCIDVEIKANIETENSCNNKATGKIIIDPQYIYGGEAPYRISINGSKNFYSDYLFKKLSPASYQLVIKDANNCIANLGNVIIKATDCSYEYVFSPNKGEVWVIPTQESSGNIKIYSKNGRLVYSLVFDVPGSYEWNGRNSAGDELPMGIYMFVLQLDQQESLSGSVTLVR